MPSSPQFAAKIPCPILSPPFGEKVGSTTACLLGSPAPHVLSAAHHRIQNLRVILAPAKISAYAVRQLSSRRIRILFQEPHRRHDEPRHAERALESLLIHHCLLHRMQRPVRRRQAFDRRYLLAAHGIRQHRAAIVRHIVNAAPCKLRTPRDRIPAWFPSAPACSAV